MTDYDLVTKIMSIPMNKETLIQALFDELSALRRVMHGSSESFLTRFNLTRPQLGMLFLLLHKSGLSVSEVAHHTGVTNGAATQTLDVMARRGLVERKTDEHDKRVSRLYLSAEGETLAQTVKSSHMAHLSKLLEGLDENELETLVKAVHNIQTLMGDGANSFPQV